MKKNSKVLEYEKLPKGSKMKFLEKHRIARSNMSRWRRKKTVIVFHVLEITCPKA